ncbi:hypothetical protein AHAS_Ahas02G0180700 [Arachis hypogaea]
MDVDSDSNSDIDSEIETNSYDDMDALLNDRFRDVAQAKRIKEELLKEAVPNLNIPTTFNKAKTMVRDLGLDYKKIDACPNDCMLYWKEHENDTFCHECGTSRWIVHPVVEADILPSKKSHNVAVKML